MSKIFLANFLSVIFTYQNQKPEQDDTSGVATPAALNEPVLSTIFQTARWSIHCYGPTMNDGNLTIQFWVPTCYIRNTSTSFDSLSVTVPRINRHWRPNVMETFIVFFFY